MEEQYTAPESEQEEQNTAQEVTQELNICRKVPLPNIYPKLAQIQYKLNAPKGQYNDFGKYKYRSCEDIMEAVKPLLRETETCLMVTDDVAVFGNRIYIKAIATLTDTITGNSVSNTAFAREPETKTGMDVAQVTGSASSYARKYALNGLFCIDDCKDSDTQDNRAEGKPKTRQAQNKPVGEYKSALTKDMLNELNNKLTAAQQKKGLSMQKFLSTYKVKRVEEMSTEQFYNAMELLKKY